MDYRATQRENIDRVDISFKVKDCETCEDAHDPKVGSGVNIKRLKELGAEGNINKDAQDCACELENWKTILLTYAQETSFHGIRQMTEQQPFILRRLLWFCVLMASGTVLLLQFGLSVKYYISWPVSVDVKINYNDSIIFPAVTLCNENAFRTTEAFDDNYFYLLSELFGGSTSDVDLGRYNAKTLSLETLYENTAHNKSDFIVRCEWQSTECILDEFVETFTDFGLCYTFNSGQNNYGLRKARTTGSEGGLRLELNIEQYQYMHGPNEGAGLKVLIHSYDEIPLVRDHGLAVLPGSHASVAVKAVEVNNLEPKHGKCNDSVELEYFDLYSVASCYTNCKEIFLRDECRCRDVYMPKIDGKPSVCTLEVYQKCMLNALDKFNTYKENCECPVPCHRLAYEPTISYASTSNFDIEAILQQEELTSELKDSYVNAREIGQKVDESILENDNKLIKSFHNNVKQMSTEISNINTELSKLETSMDISFRDLSYRIKTHLHALNQVSRVTEAYFLRGWDKFKERLLNFVLTDYMNLAKSMKSVKTIAEENLNTTDEYTRQVVFAPVEATYRRRIRLMNQTMQYLSDITIAYTLGVPLIPVKNETRFEKDYISLSLMDSKVLEETYGRTPLHASMRRILVHLNNMTEAIQLLLQLGREYVETGHFNESEFDEHEHRYKKVCEWYNGRAYQLEYTSILRPRLILEEDTTAFKILNRTMISGYSTVKRKISEIQTLIQTSQNDHWNYIINIAELSLKYITNPYKLGTNTKTFLGELMTSHFTQDSVQQLQSMLSSLYLKLGDLRNSVSSLQVNYEEVWKTLITYKHTQPFYKAIDQYIQEFEESFKNRSKFDASRMLKPESATSETTTTTATFEYANESSYHFGGAKLEYDGVLFNPFFERTNNKTSADNSNETADSNRYTVGMKQDNNSMELTTSTNYPWFGIQNEEKKKHINDKFVTDYEKDVSTSNLTIYTLFPDTVSTLNENHMYYISTQVINERANDRNEYTTTNPIDFYLKRTSSTVNEAEFENNIDGTIEPTKEYYTENNFTTQSILSTNTEQSFSDLYKIDLNNYKEYLKVFSEFIGKNIKTIHKLPTEDIARKMNADVFQSNITLVMDDIKDTFSDIIERVNALAQIAKSDDNLIESYENYLKALSDFMKKNEIDPRFYRENFMHLDIYMQELRYEEITQQKAYDIIQLLGDIGGSMGLFIGGSLVSVIEFIDLFLHNGAKRCRSKQQRTDLNMSKKPTELDEKQDINNDKDNIK